MADGDNADTSVGKRILLGREPLQFSYFCDSHVETCISEQHKLLGFQLAEKEKEAEITYDDSISELFSGEAQIDPAFVQLLFNANAPASLDGLVDVLSTLSSSGDKNQTRFFDLLFVTGKGAKLLEELKAVGASYDLYDADAKDKLSTMTMYASLLSDFDVEKSESNRFTANLAMLLSMLATGEEPLVSSALVAMSKCLNLHWDALLLARYYLGSEHSITRRVRDVWTKAVLMDEGNNHFPMIKMARSLNSSNLKDIAHTLMAQVGSKTKGYELIDAYRCLALTLANNSSQLPVLERKLEVAEASTMMRSIFVTMLGWGKTLMAKCTLADLAQRVSGIIPPDIYQIGLTCLVELVEALQGVDQSSVVPEGIFSTMATKWRDEMTGGHGEMSKLKAGTLGSQKVLYGWIQQLGAALRGPLLEEPNLNRKMECVFLATEFLHEMLRWAASDKEEEKLHLLWPETPCIKMTVKDECMVTRQRGRTSSVASASSTTKDDGKKQSKKGDGKEERLAAPAQDARNQSGGGQRAPVQDVRKEQSGPRSGGNQQNKEGWRHGSEQQYPNRGVTNQWGGGDAGHGQGNQQNSGASWQRPQTAQYQRKNQQNTGGVGDFNGSQEMHGGAAAPQKLFNPAQTPAPSHGTNFYGQSNRMDQPRSPLETPFNSSVPPPSSSGIVLTTKTEASSSLPVIDQESLAPAQTLKDDTAPLSEMYNNQQPQPITHSFRAPLFDPTPEQIQARLDESMKRNASPTQLAATGQETFGSRAGISESGAPGFVDESADTGVDEHNSNPLHVDVQSQQSAESVYGSTPRFDDLCSPSRQAYSPGLSPALQNVARATTEMVQSAAPTAALSVPPPTLPPIETQSMHQQNQPMETPVQQQSSMQQPPSVMTIAPPVSAPSTGYTRLFSSPPPPVAPFELQQAASVMPPFGDTATSQSSHPATSAQQMDHSMNEQVAPTFSGLQQQQTQFVHQADAAASMGEEQQQIHEPLQQSNTLDSFLSVIDMGGGMGGGVLQDPVNAHQHQNNEHSNIDGWGGEETVEAWSASSQASTAYLSSTPAFDNQLQQQQQFTFQQPNLPLNGGEIASQMSSHSTSHGFGDHSEQQQQSHFQQSNAPQEPTTTSVIPTWHDPFALQQPQPQQSSQQQMQQGPGFGTGGPIAAHNTQQQHQQHAGHGAQPPRQYLNSRYGRGGQDQGHQSQNKPSYHKGGRGGGESGGFGAGGFGGTSGDNGGGGNRAKLTCFNCDVEGHRSNECKQPKKEGGERGGRRGGGGGQHGSSGFGGGSGGSGGGQGQGGGFNGFSGGNNQQQQHGSGFDGGNNGQQMSNPPRQGGYGGQGASSGGVNRGRGGGLYARGYHN